MINSICKIFNGVLTTRLQNWSEKKNQVLDESQAGFLKNNSTVDMFSLHAVVRKYKEGVFIAFLLIFVEHSTA